MHRSHQAFERACSCFGIGRYFYDFTATWVDLDQNRQPRSTPPLPACDLPENWRIGMRPSATNGNCTSVPNKVRTDRRNDAGPVTASQPGPSNGTNGHGHPTVPASMGVS